MHHTINILALPKCSKLTPEPLNKMIFVRIYFQDRHLPYHLVINNEEYKDEDGRYHHQKSTSIPWSEYRKINHIRIQLY